MVMAVWFEDSYSAMAAAELVGHRLRRRVVEEHSPDDDWHDRSQFGAAAVVVDEVMRKNLQTGVNAVVPEIVF